ncbi:class I SAM-dependent methyltransferase [Candidatus Microgenomates bacterium]|nr:class I SAM-dependent methyltransferase [Candidatus Microgenomates bacterium]
MKILPGIRPKVWWEDFWRNPLCDYGDPGKTLLSFATEFYSELARDSVKPKAVDIGSGNGRYAVSLAEIGYAVDAVELASSGVKRILKAAEQNNVAVNAIQADFTQIWQMQKNYDLVLSSGLIEEVDPIHHKNIIHGHQNWTKKGGYALIKYCLEIKGRGQLVEEDLVPGLFTNSNWKIIYANEEKEMHPSRAKFTKENEIDSAIRTGTIIVQKLATRSQ